MADQSPNAGSELAERLLNRIQDASTVIHELSAEIRGHSIELASVTSDLRNLRESVASITKILTGSNGDSLVTRVSLLEEATERVEDALDKNDTRCDKKHCALMDRATAELVLKKNANEIEEKKILKDERSARLKFFATIITAVLALVGSILALTIKH